MCRGYQWTQSEFHRTCPRVTGHGVPVVQADSNYAACGKTTAVPQCAACHWFEPPADTIRITLHSAPSLPYHRFIYYLIQPSIVYSGQGSICENYLADICPLNTHQVEGHNT